MQCLECKTENDVSERTEPFLKDLYGEDTPILLCDRCYKEEVSPLEGSNDQYTPGNLTNALFRVILKK